MSLSRNEVIKLLAIVAIIDDRETDDPMLVRAWHVMSEQGRWESFAAAERALYLYRSEQPNYPVRPGHITQVLERVRKAASLEFNRRELNPPKAALDDPDEYARWVKAAAAEHHARALARFVAGDRGALKAIEAAS